MVRKGFWRFLPTLLILLFFASFLSGYYIRKSFFAQVSEKEGQTNFLLLGITGSGTGDGDLTDTMIFTSINTKTKKAVLLSLPRDIWIKNIQAKINTAYHYGGFDLAKETVGEVLGQKTDYVLVLDFAGFEKAVDIIGGIRIEVARTFDDYKYPIPGKEKDLCNGDKELQCRYEHLHFEAGVQLMDGKTALKFVRSRNAEGEEGTDFARSARQQKLLAAFKQKVLSPEILLRPTKLYALFRVFQSSVKTDLRVDQYGTLLLKATKINWEKMTATSINENLLIHPKTHYSKQWVLIPQSGNWREIQEFAQGLLE